MPGTAVRELGAWHCIACRRLNAHCRACGGHLRASLELAERKSRAIRASQGEVLDPVRLPTSGAQGPAPRPLSPLDTDRPGHLPSPEAIFRLEVPVMRHIPRGCRTNCAVVLGKVIAAAVETPSWENMLRLFLFPKFVLRAPAHGGASRTNSIQSMVRDRAMTLASQPVEALWDDLCQSAANLERRSGRRMSRKRPRVDPEVPDAEMARMADPKTVGTIRALAVRQGP